MSNKYSHLTEYDITRAIQFGLLKQFRNIINKEPVKIESDKGPIVSRDPSSSGVDVNVEFVIFNIDVSGVPELPAPSINFSVAFDFTNLTNVDDQWVIVGINVSCGTGDGIIQFDGLPSRPPGDEPEAHFTKEQDIRISNIALGYALGELNDVERVKLYHAVLDVVVQTTPLEQGV